MSLKDELFYGQVYSVNLLVYMMQCCRVKLGEALMEPPLPNRHLPTTQESLLENLTNYYLQLMCMLNDSMVTDREIQMVQNYAPLKYFAPILPQIKYTDIEKIPLPEKMDHKDYVFLIKKCNGYYLHSKDYLFFLNELDKKKFKYYYFLKYFK